MPRRSALDVAAKQLHPRTEDHFEGGIGIENRLEYKDVLKGRGQIRIPEAQKIGAQLESAQEALADGFGFAAVGFQIENLEGFRVKASQPPEHIQRPVGAAVVDRQKRDRGVGSDK